jgi:hypothetical protein
MKATVLIFTFLTFLNNNSNCDKLKDGVYQAIHTSKNAVDYTLTIAGDGFIQQNGKMNVKGKVNWIDNCSLKLIPEVKIKQDTSELAGKFYKSFGEPFIQIKATKGDTTYFRTTWTGNLHISLNEGYFLKVK